jgi:Fe-S cluster assembly iron-binding protein IscA
MVLDEPQEDDEVIKKNGSAFVIKKDLLERVKPVRLDFVEGDMGSGYAISSSLSNGGGCGSSCSC